MRKKQPLVLQEPPEDPSAADTVESAIIVQEDRQQFTAVLAELPYIYREVLMMHYYFELSVTEISETLGSPAGTIKSRLKRGRDLVESRLQEVDFREACGRQVGR